MAIKAWKKLEQSNGFRKLKLKFKQVSGKEPKFQTDIKMSVEDYSGWSVVPELISENDIMYSIGICDDIDFDLEMIRKKQLKVFAFDPTPYSVNWISQQSLPPEFNFSPWAVSDKDGTFFFYPRIKKDGQKSEVMYTFHKQEMERDDGVSVEALTIESMTQKLGHKSVDILKMDIEGAEYDVIDNMLGSALRPKMLLIEFHHRFKGIGKEKTIQAVQALQKEGYLIVDISVTGREMTFVHNKALHKKGTA